MNLLVIADDESLGPDLPDYNVDLMVSCGDLPDALIFKAAERCRCRKSLLSKAIMTPALHFPLRFEICTWPFSNFVA